ncbi:MerR family transcriptional regulator [Pseudoclavibacter chungangensis]|uniref:MerR family transcriptional regulator n=1 Tax=Pseudoclavibacter chungangensis TaxID=587635 RepID=A0A7J5BTY3_9MICO|nr:MerR family transcriptional regulator [Pseudoclavibacter chungangensis]KAB1657798.1 MerR family transcriptional regulator [Pseudoclavibacter chungangensis]NYJ66614.1 MerR family gold-responsive transcriptional activator of gol and ges genes [Pseudoclavibacter chungangensis]
MRIGDAAAAIGASPHVLRHWHDEGVVVPDRTPSGRREYRPEHVERLRIVRACQDAGLSLAEIRGVLHRDEAGRSEIVRARLAEVRRRLAHLAATERFLEHVLDCRHDLVSACDECSDYARPDGARRRGPDAITRA